MLNVNLFIRYITVINIIMRFVTDCVRKARWIWHFFWIQSVTNFLMNVSFRRVTKLFVCWHIFERWRSLSHISVFISLLTFNRNVDDNHVTRVNQWTGIIRFRGNTNLNDIPNVIIQHSPPININNAKQNGLL